MFNKLQLGTQSANFLAKAKLTGAAAIVLLKLQYSINKMNIVVGTPAHIAKASGITIHRFNMGIRYLKKYDLVRKLTAKEYMLHPDIMFNGDDKRYHIIKHMWDTQTHKGLRDNAG